MSFLAVTEAKLPPGFRFHPRDDELVCDYLARKISKEESNEVPAMVEVDLNKCEPWDLPDSAKVGKEWYFFSQRDRKYSTGLRTNRATISGYWKDTGKDRQIHDVRTGQRVGARKTLVFYNGRAPKGRKSDWVMHEFRIQGSPASLTELPPFEEDWVLCRVFHKNRGSSTKSGTGDSYHERISSSSLPALVDHSFHVSSINPEGYEHGPCFSNLLQNHTTHFEERTEVGVRFDNLWPDYEEGFISDSHVFKSVLLDHLIGRAEEGGIKSELSPAIGGESFTRSVHSTYSHGNYLSDTELSHMWNNFEPQ